MSEKEVDRREEILNEYDSSRKYIEQTCRPELFNAMDEYFTERAYELLEYMAKNDIKCTWYNHEVLGKQYVFKYRGQELSKEQLFENFL